MHSYSYICLPYWGSHVRFFFWWNDSKSEKEKWLLFSHLFILWGLRLSKLWFLCRLSQLVNSRVKTTTRVNWTIHPKLDECMVCDKHSPMWEQHYNASLSLILTFSFFYFGFTWMSTFFQNDSGMKMILPLSMSTKRTFHWEPSIYIHFWLKV